MLKRLHQHLYKNCLIGYDLPTIKAMAKDETVLANIEKAYKELSTQKISGVGKSVGGIVSGVVDFFTDTPEEIKEIEKQLRDETGESWKFSNILNVYVSSSGKIKSKQELFVGNIWKGLSENIVSPFLKGVSESFED
jgi:DNA-binding transcriptional regulator YhcF (GntR family)